MGGECVSKAGTLLDTPDHVGPLLLMPWRDVREDNLGTGAGGRLLKKVTLDPGLLILPTRTVSPSILSRLLWVCSLPFPMAITDLAAFLLLLIRKCVLGSAEAGSRPCAFKVKQTCTKINLMPGCAPQGLGLGNKSDTAWPSESSSPGWEPRHQQSIASQCHGEVSFLAFY